MKTSININDIVEFELTEYGAEILNEKIKQLKANYPQVKSFRGMEDFWPGQVVRKQLWSVIEDFGNYTSLGLDSFCRGGTMVFEFNRKDGCFSTNIMKYLNTKMIQRFTSNLSNLLSDVQLSRHDVEITISDLKSCAAPGLPYWYRERETLKKQYVWFSSLQKEVKSSEVFTHSTLQKMEVAVTNLINIAETDVVLERNQHTKCCRGNTSRKTIRHLKQKIVKLVELQQAIRKQKSISGGI